MYANEEMLAGMLILMLVILMLILMLLNLNTSYTDADLQSKLCPCAVFIERKVSYI